MKSESIKDVKDVRGVTDSSIMDSSMQIALLIVGFVLGLLFFLIVEGGRGSNSFYSGCWVRKQPDWITHTKVYFLGTIIAYKGLEYKDSLLTLLGAAWFGLHLGQDIAERIYKNNMDTKINTV